MHGVAEFEALGEAAWVQGPSLEHGAGSGEALVGGDPERDLEAVAKTRSHGKCEGRRVVVEEGKGWDGQGPARSQTQHDDEDRLAHPGLGNDVRTLALNRIAGLQGRRSRDVAERMGHGVIAEHVELSIENCLLGREPERTILDRKAIAIDPSVPGHGLPLGTDLREKPDLALEVHARQRAP